MPVLRRRGILATTTFIIKTRMHDHGKNPLTLNGRPPVLHWSLLLVLTLIFAGLFDAIHLPAALLLGAMLGSILVAIADGTPRITRAAFVVAQGVVGCLVARSITPEILVSLREDWLLFISVTLVVTLACAAIGWILARRRILPGTTAIWGTSPGGASVMTLMSDAHGGDMRLVAVMQYLRVVIVTVVATVVSHLWIDNASTSAHSIFSGWFIDVSWAHLAGTLALASGGSVIAQRLKLPGGALLLPLILGSTLQATGAMPIVLPPWILAPAYAVLGWCIGLRFTRKTLAQAARALPSMILSISCLIAICAGIAFGLTCLSGIDPLTAYLATSPGGLDAIAIIAASSGVNIPFIMAFQTARLLIVVSTGPALARFIARRL
jgi:membrane AbrB-like protein